MTDITIEYSDEQVLDGGVNESSVIVSRGVKELVRLSVQGYADEDERLDMVKARLRALRAKFKAKRQHPVMRSSDTIADSDLADGVE